MNGYAGRLLSVDLASGRADTFVATETALRAFIGGSGLGAWLFLQRSWPEWSLSPWKTPCGP